MRLLLVAFTLAFSSLGFARTNSPELVSWAEYYAMRPEQKYGYLKAVSEAMAEFEYATNKELAGDQYASIPYFRSLFGNVLENFIPEAAAVATDQPADCLNTKFTVPGHAQPGSFCVNTVKETKCTNPQGRDQSSFARIDSMISQCRVRFEQFPDAVRAYRQYASLHPEQNPRNVVPETAPATRGLVVDANPPLPSRLASKRAEACDPIEKTERRALRKAYRESSEPECLVGGVNSTYPDKKPGSRCAPKASYKTVTGKATTCTAKNTYNASGVIGKVIAGKRTACIGELYCTQTGEPYCVEATDKAFALCGIAQAKTENKLKFGPECINNDRESFERIAKRFRYLCNSPKGQKLLCNDCSDLEEKFRIARSQFSNGSSGAPPAGTTAAD